MDNQNWKPSPAPHGEGGGAGAPGPVPGGVGGGDAPATDAVDWRSELSAESRDKIVSKIMETLKKHLPVSGPVGYDERKKIAVRFEEKIYRVASSQSNYLRKISKKMLTMETKSQNTIPSAMPSNSNVIINKPSDSGSPVGVRQESMIQKSNYYGGLGLTRPWRRAFAMGPPRFKGRNNIDSDGNIQGGGHGGGSISGRGGVFGRYLEKQRPVELPKNNEDIDLSLKL